MFRLNESIEKRQWDKKMMETFNKIIKSQNSFLKMHSCINNENIRLIQEFMYFNYLDITASQLRNIYKLVLNVDKAKPLQLSLQRVKLAYISGRTDKGKKGLINVLSILDSLFESVENDTEKFMGVKTFLEALVAYHKYYESLGDKYIKDKK